MEILGNLMKKPDCSTCCGSCCKGISLPLSSRDADEVAWMETRGVVAGGFWHIRSVCRFLHSGRCVRYSKRPGVCRRFVVGGKGCLLAREHFG